MWRDDAYLLDILLAARKALQFTERVKWEEFRDSEILQNAVMHQIQIIGEAARSLSEAYRDSHPGMHWRGNIGMRNRLVHEYFRIVPARVWKVVVEELPELVAQLQPLVPPESSPS